MGLTDESNPAHEQAAPSNTASQQATANTIKSLHQQRGIVKAHISRIKNYLNNASEFTNTIDLECRLEILNSYIKQIMWYQSKVEKLNPQDEKRGEIEEICIATKTKLLTLLGRNRPRENSLLDQTIAMPTVNRLPSLKLPKFDGKYSDFKNFFGSFKTLVHEESSLSDIEKFNHLLSCLSGDALRTVQAFQVTGENYKKALERLQDRYDKKCLICFDSIEQIFSIPPISRPDASELRKAVDIVSATYDSLLSIGSEKEIANALIIHLMLVKVDPVTKAKWNDSLDYSTLPTWDQCVKVLIRRCQSLEVNDEKPYPEKTRQVNKDKKQEKRFSFNCTEDNNESKCTYCHSLKHRISHCESFSKLLVSQRFNFAKANALCINCLRKGHTVAQCRSSRCRLCKGAHHTLLHKQENQPKSSLSSHVIDQNPQSDRTALSVMNSNNATNYANQHVVILATAVVHVKDLYGNFKPARVLLDSGSQVNFMTEECANRLELKLVKSNLHVSGIGELNTGIKHKTSAVIKSLTNAYQFFAEFWVIKSISSFQPETSINISQWKIPQNISLADPQFNKRQKIDILIGAEVFFELLCVGQIKLGESMPLLQKTLLGWIVSGKAASSNCIQQSTALVAQDQSLGDIDSTLKQFWELEEIPKPKAKLTPVHQECESHFKLNTKLLQSGRFEVKLPFKQNPSILGQSYEIAKRRYLLLERKLIKTLEIQTMYNDFMREYINLNHMSLIKKIDLDSPHYFIPHQCVLRLDSVTTKLRVVFDASARTTSQISLNDILLVGPTIQPDLYTILLKFRCRKYAITADITKMYRQVEIAKEDRKYQLILWRENPTLPIQTYQLNTVTYGTAAAPFLAIRCLTELAEMYQETHKLGSKVIKNDFYVDDLLTGGEDLDQLEAVRNQITSILNAGGFQLAKWYSNHEFYWKNNAEKPLEFNGDSATKTLGLMWNPNTDNFHFILAKDFINLKGTKRNILSTTSRLFDPLGLVSPLIVKSKILIQTLWLNKLNWDEAIPQHLNTAWEQFKKELTKVESISIPRFVHTSSQAFVQIHGFADASIRAYGCCIYVRTTNQPITTHLLTAKSKVAPTKTISLPRLELCAAHLLAKLWKQIEQTLLEFVLNVTFWTDSQTVLKWLKMHPSTLNTFVGNRVSELQDWSTNIDWRYVPSKLNPADLVSRGCSVDNLQSSIWFQGPSFLQADKKFWPSAPQCSIETSDDVLEIKKSAVILSANTNEHFIFKIIDNFSSYIKIIKIFAYIYRFITRKKFRSKSSHITTKEMNWACLKVVSILQQHEFAEEIKDIENSKTLKASVQKLTPFIQIYKDGERQIKLLRVGGRLLNANVTYDAKFPLLLSNKNRFVYLYLLHLHITNCHCGPKILVGLLRQRMWIINARELARQIVRKCIHCFKYKPKLLSQLMGNLPADRFRCIRPFLGCGVDFCGPIYTSYRIRGRPPYKTYIAIFVCFSSKAVHIELATDLSTNAFISVLKRFIGRRGVPEKIYCDNATNFVGACAELKKLKVQFFNDLKSNKLQNFVSSQGLEFVFIPPRSPHFGGLWEASVKSAKTLMFRTVANANLTFEELSTVVIEIESILNTRPIAPLSQDPNDGEALTPGHLLTGSSLKAIPEGYSEQAKISFLKRYQLISSLKNKFWRAFQRDYFHELHQRTKWFKPHNNLKVGDIVLVHEDNLPPLKWLMGRVTEIFSGRDGRVRVANVQTTNGTIRRTIHKLALLPCNES